MTVKAIKQKLVSSIDLSRPILPISLKAIQKKSECFGRAWDPLNKICQSCPGKNLCCSQFGLNLVADEDPKAWADTSMLEYKRLVADYISRYKSVAKRKKLEVFTDLVKIFMDQSGYLDQMGAENYLKDQLQIAKIKTT